MSSRTEKCANCKNKNLLVECECGCGGIRTAIGLDGRQRYLINYHNKKDWIGSKHPSWKGGRWIDHNGYVRIHKSEHPHADLDGYIYEHRLIMEEYLGRYLYPWEDVHHRNGIRDDNRIENLQLVTHKQHLSITHTGKKHRLGKRHSEETKKNISIAQKIRLSKKQ